MVLGLRKTREVLNNGVGWVDRVEASVENFHQEDVVLSPHEGVEVGTAVSPSDQNHSSSLGPVFAPSSMPHAHQSVDLIPRKNKKSLFPLTKNKVGNANWERFSTRVKPNDTDHTTIATKQKKYQSLAATFNDKVKKVWEKWKWTKGAPDVNVGSSGTLVNEEQKEDYSVEVNHPVERLSNSCEGLSSRDEQEALSAPADLFSQIDIDQPPTTFSLEAVRHQAADTEASPPIIIDENKSPTTSVTEHHHEFEELPLTATTNHQQNLDDIQPTPVEDLSPQVDDELQHDLGSSDSHSQVAHLEDVEPAKTINKDEKSATDDLRIRNLIIVLAQASVRCQKERLLFRQAQNARKQFKEIVELIKLIYEGKIEGLEKTVQETRHTADVAQTERDSARADFANYIATAAASLDEMTSQRDSARLALINSDQAKRREIARLESELNVARADFVSYKAKVEAYLDDVTSERLALINHDEANRNEIASLESELGAARTDFATYKATAEARLDNVTSERNSARLALINHEEGRRREMARLERELYAARTDFANFKATAEARLDSLTTERDSAQMELINMDRTRQREAESFEARLENVVNERDSVRLALIHLENTRQMEVASVEARLNHITNERDTAHLAFMNLAQTSQSEIARLVAERDAALSQLAIYQQSHVRMAIAGPAVNHQPRTLLQPPPPHPRHNNGVPHVLLNNHRFASQFQQPAPLQQQQHSHSPLQFLPIGMTRTGSVA
ncbi:hypothetical protein HDU76_002703, partial [Blyttiomyces sp. JEL0837]